MYKKKLKEIFQDPLQSMSALLVLVIIVYFSIGIWNEIKPQKPKTYHELYMDCLNLGSNAKAFKCIELLEQTND